MAQRAVFYVSADGSDEWSGTRPQPNAAGSDGPFATLERAREAVRAREKGSAATVYARGGRYALAATFALTAEDGGGPGAPVVYRAFDGEEVRLTGGRPVSGFRGVEDNAVRSRLSPAAREHVRVADLRAQGITDYGEMTSRGFGRPVHTAGLEVFFRDRPMTLARYPNDGWLHIADTPDGQPGGKFTVEDDRLRRWSRADDVWVHGYWTYDWADTYEQVARLDPDSGLVVTEPPHGVYGYTKGQRFYFLNVLEELDSPGEWYLDRAAGLLYFWPPEPLTDGDVEVSSLPTLVTMTDVSYVTLRGFVLENCRADAVQIQGGSHNVVGGCVLRNTGNRAAVIQGGTHHAVAGCDIYDTGDGGVVLSGGDRQTLTPAHLSAENNDIFRYSRWSRTYRPAVSVSGVGNRAAHNRIHDAPHMGIAFGGNDHVLEFNEVYDICKETGDVGAFYTGRDWTTRGTVVRHNFFHHIHGPYTHGAMAVYLDDSACGTTIYGNVFYKASRAAFIGGGRDNVVENNVFVECHPSVHLDARAVGWAKGYAAPGGDWHMYEKLEAVHHDQPPYSTRYPELANILDDDPALPKGNVVRRNVHAGGRWMDIAREAAPFTTIEENFTEGDPLFLDAERLDFRVSPESPVWVNGFRPIPFERIGLVRDGYRDALPRGERDDADSND
jgi:hypothetical protein